MKEFFETMQKELSHQDLVLVTVVASSGSTPRGSGARMLVSSEGRLCGTIGGGPVEFKALQIAEEVLQNRCSAKELFRLHPNHVADIGMICGGNVEVFFHFIPANDANALCVAGKVLEQIAQNQACWLVTETSGASDSFLAVITETEGTCGHELPEAVVASAGIKPVLCETEQGTFFLEQIVYGETVWIFGGGHVSQQLVPTLARVDFHCVVIEDREEFAAPELFENKALRTKVVPVSELDTLIPEVREGDMVCVMTRGHKNDYIVQKHMLKTPASYIGVIGSKSKIAEVNRRLGEDGFSQEEIARITAPIGLDICSETPAEIAISIAAQLIEVRAERRENPKYLKNRRT